MASDVDQHRMAYLMVPHAIMVLTNKPNHGMKKFVEAFTMLTLVGTCWLPGNIDEQDKWKLSLRCAHRRHLTLLPER